MSNEFVCFFKRANFNLTRAISTITRVAPDRRVETLMKFRRRLAETPQVNDCAFDII